MFVFIDGSGIVLTMVFCRLELILRIGAPSLANMSSPTLPPASTSSSHYCDKNAIMVCSGCRKAVNVDVTLTWYCTAECQKLDWKSHKSACKFIQSRKGLHKVAMIFEEAYKFDGNTWAVNRSMGMKDGMMMVAYEETKDEHINIEEVTKYWINLLAVRRIHPLIHSTLIRRGIARKITELISQVTRFDCLLKDGSPDTHAPKPVVFKYIILKIQLVDGGGDYALDLYGAFLGKGKLLTPWSQYLNERLPSSLEASGRTYTGPSRELGMVYESCSKHSPLDKYMMYERDGLVMGAFEWNLRQGLRIWEERNMTLKALLKLLVAEIMDRKKELCASLIRSCSAYANSKVKRTSFVCAFDEMMARMEQKRNNDELQELSLYRLEGFHGVNVV
ncbi:hypothetical protein DL98DRAFT_590245 [Cadophora sp. DSE1049]|nr:hypothetical protein DL98DRAFT_590245 [Cadophora sp. DSE1049]